MKENLDFFGKVEIKKEERRRTSGVHMKESLFDRAAVLANKHDMSTNAVLVQLIEIGLDALEAKENNREKK